MSDGASASPGAREDATSGNFNAIHGRLDPVAASPTQLIPPFNISGVLPPFVGLNPADRGGCSPYLVHMSEVVSRFASSRERMLLLQGLLDLREEMRNLGVNQGVQWLDGSFVENVEATASRPPADIDVVTFAARPISDPSQWAQLVGSNPHLFTGACKARYGCDHYFLDTMKPVEIIIADTAYFSHLFAHNRRSLLWKGMIAVPLDSDDGVVSAVL
jgi:hypothetical protein